MKLYIKNYSSYRSDIDSIEIKKELKQRYKLDTRRQDDFIHLAVFGAQKLKEKTEINKDDELYVTSGVGNIDVLQRTDLYVYREKQFIKPFDFINMLGNTTSYYVASSLGVKGKNIFQISDNFTFINSLISIYASMSISNKDAILGSIDLVNEPDEVMKRVLGISEDTEVVSSVNYQKFSLLSENAIAEVEFDTKVYTSENIKYINEFIKAEINVEPTLISLKNEILYVGFFFPNYPTTNDYERLKKYRYFKDVRKAITHSLEANWDVSVDNYNEIKIYPNLLDSKYLLICAIFEIGIFQNLLDTYKETDMCKIIIKKKLAYGGYKSGLAKANLSEEEKKLLTQPANEKKIFMSKVRLEETLLHIMDTEEIPKLTVGNIVTRSKEIFDRGLGHKTVAKYLKEIKSELGIK